MSTSRTSPATGAQGRPAPGAADCTGSAGPAPTSVAALVAALVGGDQRALARAITAVEDDTEAADAVLAAVAGHNRPAAVAGHNRTAAVAGHSRTAAVAGHTGTATVVGLTGPPGAGKSTLTDAMVGELRRRGRTVAVLAVDPSSPLSGGAILGDRIRMLRHSEDPGVYVRSVAARGHLGGLFATVDRVLAVLAAWGPDVVLVETVGAGQSEVEIARFAQVKVVVSTPGLGDEVQAMKAGILEIADILVVNKADQPGADATADQLRRVLHWRDPNRPAVPVVCTVATDGTGVGELVDLLQVAAPASTAAGGIDDG